MINIKKYIPAPLRTYAHKVVMAIEDVISVVIPSTRVYNYLGFSIYYNQGNSLIDRLKRERVFEPQTCKILVNELGKKEGIFLDIGANIGLISFYVKKNLPHVEIHAFEPGIHQNKLLQMSVDKNKVSSMKVYKDAISDSRGTVSFHIHNPRYAAFDGMKDTARRGKTKQIEVPTTTVDIWWCESGMPKISVVKVDTEGAEFFVLKGMEQMIREQKPVILLEISPSNLKAYPYDHSDIYNWLKERNYSLSTLAGFKVKNTIELESFLLKEDTFIARPH